MSKTRKRKKEVEVEAPAQREVIRGAKSIAAFLDMSHQTFYVLLEKSSALRAAVGRDENNTWVATRKALLEYVESRRSAS